MTSPCLDILTFHRIMPDKEQYFIPPMAMTRNTFQPLLEKLASAGRIISMEQGVRQLKSNTLKGRKVAVTFDDGYKDNFVLARDILLRLGVPATFFIPVQPIDEQKPYWWDHLNAVFIRKTQSFFKWAMERSLPFFLGQALHNLQMDTNRSKDKQCRSLVQALNQSTETERTEFLSALIKEFGPCPNMNLLMSWDDIKKLNKDGFSIGSHGISHIPLTDINDRTARNEITESARLLQNRTGCRPTGFCYPRGAYTQIHTDMVRQSGYTYAVTTQFGKNTCKVDNFVLKRRNMSDYQGLRACFPVTMHLLELSGRLDTLLAARRAG